MKFKFLLFLLIITVTNTFGQIVFEQGYFIDNAGKKTECLIKNIGWKNNPVDFTYKLSPEDKNSVMLIEDVNEFGISNTIKFQKFTVELDRSSSNVSNLSIQRAPEWYTETVMLQVLIEGNANLYYYGEGSLKRYFFSKEEDLPKQLIYKKYTDENRSGATKINKTFQNQLWAGVRIEGQTVSSVTKLSYNLTQLEKYFIKYNELKGVSFTKYSNSVKGNGVQLNVKATTALNYESLSFWNDKSDGVHDVNFGYGLNYKIGIELEAILPFNKNKWSVFLDPKFSKYSAEEEYQLRDRSTGTVKTEINTLELELGARHYFFLNEKSKLFIDASVFYNTYLSSSYFEFSDGTELEFLDNIMLFFGVGIGYDYNNKFSVELRRNPVKKLFPYVFMQTKTNSYSLIFTYTILNTKKKKK